ncbi:hypothetical protein CTA1_11522 [Colletotrichum tanaceti]|uniref:Uncharacterized protein n=1 Tax=Colletotrichum tanaceti TaxID=1306861 RepID=A0A4V6DHS7_9PEZI|nr:hypothetical protein CTA1_11522 [Colletotrichum tanaceti]
MGVLCTQSCLRPVGAGAGALQAHNTPKIDREAKERKWGNYARGKGRRAAHVLATFPQAWVSLTDDDDDDDDNDDDDNDDDDERSRVGAWSRTDREQKSGWPKTNRPPLF